MFVTCYVTGSRDVIRLILFFCGSCCVENQHVCDRCFVTKQQNVLWLFICLYFCSWGKNSKNNIPDNTIVGNNSFLRPNEDILKVWQKLVLNQQISICREY